MRMKQDWDKVRRKYVEYWNRENDRPLIAVCSPKNGPVTEPPKPPESLPARWTDTEYIIKSERIRMENTFFGGDALPIMNPNLGPDIFGAFLGCELEFGEVTSWSRHCVDSWNKTDKFRFDPENPWWKKVVEITEAAVSDSKGDYLVGITDLHAGMDGLVSLRGPDRLCMDLYDDPDAVKTKSFELLDVFKEAINRLYSITSKNQEGSVNWSGLWHPGKWYVTSSDFICMISSEMFREFVLPELLAELEFLDMSIFHLDGPGALKHLDDLLLIPSLHGIQWVYGAGQPTACHWLHVLKKIQDAGKLIQINIVPEDLDILLENLDPQGVMYNCECADQETAERMVRRVEESRGPRS